MTVNTAAPTVKVLFCGGAGALISRFLPEKLPEWAVKPTFQYLDTSDSDKAFVRNDAKFAMFGDPDTRAGSGGVRGTKAAIVREQLPTYLMDNPHADINIIVVSSSGASGAIIAHYMAESMLAEGKKVILLVSQSPSTFVRANNSLKTLLSFRQLCKKHKQSMVGYIYETNGQGFEKSDRFLIQDLTVLMYFLNGKISGVDASDIDVLLSPEKLPDMGYEPDFYSINLLFEDKYGLDATPMAILTLSPIGETDDIGSGAPVTYSGIIDDDAFTKMYASEGGIPVVSLAIFNVDIPSAITALARLIDQHKKRLDLAKTVKVEMPKSVNLEHFDGDILL